MKDLGVGGIGSHVGEVVEVEWGGREGALDGSQQLAAHSLQRGHDGRLGALRVGSTHLNPKETQHNF